MVWPVMLDLSTVVDEKGRGFKASDSGLPNMLQCNFETGFGSLNESVSSYFLWETEYYPVEQSSILWSFFAEV